MKVVKWLGSVLLQILVVVGIVGVISLSLFEDETLRMLDSLGLFLPQGVDSMKIETVIERDFAPEIQVITGNCHMEDIIELTASRKELMWYCTPGKLIVRIKRTVHYGYRVTYNQPIAVAVNSVIDTILPGVPQSSNCTIIKDPQLDQEELRRIFAYQDSIKMDPKYLQQSQQILQDYIKMEVKKIDRWE